MRKIRINTKNVYGLDFETEQLSLLDDIYLYDIKITSPGFWYTSKQIAIIEVNNKLHTVPLNCIEFVEEEK